MKKIIIAISFIFSILLINYFFLKPKIVYAEDSFCSGVPQDLNSHASDQVFSRLNQSKSDVGLDIYSYRGTNNYSDIPSIDKPWKRNLDSWFQKVVPLDFTGVSGWNDDVMNRVSGEDHRHWSPYTGGATLITPRHFVAAEHFKLYPGTTIFFFDKNGKPVKRKVIDIISVDDLDSDISIGLLDSDVDSSIMNYSLIESTTLRSYLQGNSPILKETPIVVFNQFAKAYVSNVFSVNLEKGGVSHWQYDALGSLKDYGGSLVVGDSGQPGFIIINNEPVLLFVNYYPNSSPLLGSYIDKIDLAINNLNQKYGVSGDYRTKKYNSSCFVKYPIINKSATINKNYGYVGDVVSFQIFNFPYSITLSSVGFGQLKGSYMFVPTISSVANQKAEFKIPQIDAGSYQIIIGDLTLPFQVLKQDKVDAPASASIESSVTNVVDNKDKQTVSYVPVTSTIYVPAPTEIPSPTPVSTPLSSVVPTPGASTSPKPSPTSSIYPSSSPVSSVVPTPSSSPVYTPTPSLSPTSSASPSPTSVPTPRLIPVQTIVYVPVISSPSPTPVYSQNISPVNVVNDSVKNNSAPLISTIGSSNVTTSSVTLNGFISSTGGVNVLVRGFEYGYSSANERSVSETGSFVSGDFSVKITGLSCGSVYKFRVFAKNSIGSTYGAEKTFTTLNCPLYYTPSVNVSSGSSVGNFSSGTRSVSTLTSQSVTTATNLRNNQSNNVGNSSVNIINKNNLSGQSTKVNSVLELKIDIKRNLKIGDSGQDVKLLQTLLNVLGYKVAESGQGSLGKETTVFDKNTELALKKYQKDHSVSGVTESGVVDNVSLILINSELNKIYNANNNSTTTLDNQNSNLPSDIIKYIVKLLESIYSKIKP